MWLQQVSTPVLRSSPTSCTSAWATTKYASRAPRAPRPTVSLSLGVGADVVCRLCFVDCRSARFPTRCRGCRASKNWVPRTSPPTCLACAAVRVRSLLTRVRCWVCVRVAVTRPGTQSTRVAAPDHRRHARPLPPRPQRVRTLPLPSSRAFRSSRTRDTRTRHTHDTAICWTICRMSWCCWTSSRSSRSMATP
jgi:hypothetical protein